MSTSVGGYRFDDFYLDASNRRLSRNGEPVALNSKYFDVLLLLVSRSGQLVEKQRLFDEVWDGVFVTDAALTQCIKDIRKQLGDDALSPRYIKTVPKHGYTFIGSVVEGEARLMPTPQNAPSSMTTAGSFATSSGAAIARPYKFLDYYTEQDANLFFGREQEVDAICSQILAHRSFILHGRSGVGKSSILRAGVMPRLKAHGHLVFVIRSFTDPVDQMAGAVSHALGIDADQHRHADVTGLLRRVEDQRHVVFFFDQFEEFFLLLTEETRRHFLTVMRELARSDLPVHLVFALREDLLAEMSQLKTAVPEIFHHEYRLKRLSREQAELAITEPARAVGCQYEPPLVARLLDDIGDSAGVDPPQLQIVCDNLYDSRDEERVITLGAYEELGGAPQILAGYLERVLHRFNPEDLVAAKGILTTLISEDGRRLVLKAAELEVRLGSLTPSTVDRVMEELVVARVLRRRRQDSAAWIELAHDFLTPEISRWLTADELALKRARGVIERAMENYQAHGLLIDSDAVELVVPFGQQLGLSDDQADLLMISALSRGREVPEWLICIAPGSTASIVEASKSPDSEVRMRAVEAASLWRTPEMEPLLRRLALWDKNLLVRKSASIALAEWIGTAVERSLSNGNGGAQAGLIRKSISLAMVRDHDRQLVRLSHLPPPVSLLVVLGLMWVRLRRDGSEIMRRGIGGMLGGAASGLVGGVILGSGLGIAREATPLEGLELVLVLVTLGFFIGAIGGLGVSFGMISLSHLAYRHSKWWSVVGGAAGGAVVGGSTKLLGVDTVRALFGQSPAGITGAAEGAVIGAGLSLGFVLAMSLIRRSRRWQRVLAAGVGAMCAGVLLTVVGGNLFSASLEIVARMFANSQIRMDPLAALFGEVHFGQTTQIVMGALEGLLFGAGVASGMEISGRSDHQSAAAQEHRK
ncbi:MAG TPA: winged helix-turn-helix domain-containing protein [Blastocatellia bacterium]|nr:winged helix-turn-helix domain-containing protein [Blastocatellia bacterium]